MTTLQWAWTTGDGEQFRIPYLYHKLQAMRFVKEQLADPELAVNDGTVAAVASLALVEVNITLKNVNARSVLIARRTHWALSTLWHHISRVSPESRR